MTIRTVYSVANRICRQDLEKNGSSVVDAKDGLTRNVQVLAKKTPISPVIFVLTDVVCQYSSCAVAQIYSRW